MNKTISFKRDSSFWSGPFVLLAVAVISLLCLFGAEQAVAHNADTLGNNLIRSFESEEERSMQQYATAAALGCGYLQTLHEQALTQQQIIPRVHKFLTQTAVGTADPNTHTYAIINGQMLARTHFAMMDHYDFTKAAWYQAALDADGDVIYTNAYSSMDPDLGTVVTVACGDASTGDVFLIDVTLDTFKLLHEKQALPERGAYFLCDANGSVLYAYSPVDSDEASLHNYIGGIFNSIQDGTLHSGDRIKDLSGVKRGVYYRRYENGWYGILTVPRSVLMTGMSGLMTSYLLAFLLLVCLSIFMWARGVRIRDAAIRTDETLHVLGNSYFALYRLDLKKSSYTTIKSSSTLRSTLPASGPYDLFLEELAERLDAATAGDFRKDFCMEHIRQLRSQRTQDFGGDFQYDINGEPIWINVRLLIDESLGRGEAVLCFREVDEERRRNLQHMKLLENALDEADASRRSQMQFFSSMSHDMRTPLNIILGMAELSLSPACTEEQRVDHLKKIQLAGKQQLSLINDILEISRLQNGQLALETRNFNICDTLNECVEPFRTQADDQHKTFTVTLHADTPNVMGDPARLNQIISNLLSNALKFTHSGDEITLALVQHGERGGNYRLTVRDTGVGMSQEYLPHLFEPYVRETRFADRTITGTGLGMPIVKSLVTRMGGTIQVESELGKGTTFTIDLPFAAGAAPMPPSDTVQTAARSAEELRGKHILVAEDNALNMEITVALLEELGITVTGAEDGAKAVEQFKASTPGSIDAILMDMQMPVMDGCAAAAAIRKLDRPGAARVPIIALTANAFAEDIARTTRAGMNAHLSKPIDVNVLCSTLLEYLCTGSAAQ